MKNQKKILKFIDGLSKLCQKENIYLSASNVEFHAPIDKNEDLEFLNCGYNIGIRSVKTDAGKMKLESDVTQMGRVKYFITK